MPQHCHIYTQARPSSLCVGLACGDASVGIAYWWLLSVVIAILWRLLTLTISVNILGLFCLLGSETCMFAWTFFSHLGLWYPGVEKRLYEHFLFTSQPVLSYGSLSSEICSRSIVSCFLWAPKHVHMNIFFVHIWVSVSWVIVGVQTRSRE